MREAMLYEKLADAQVRCFLCAHRCKINPSKRGLCGVRENIEGVLYSLVYGMLIAEHVDPIEKKPLFHVFPGSKSYSIATVGCNFRCLFCQNHEISQMPVEDKRILGREAPPQKIVRQALDSGSKTIAYTYTEPTIYFEYAYDIAKIAHDKGLKNVFVTNGFMTEETITKIAPYLDAANVDLKAFTEEFYKKNCGARLEPVLKSLKKMKEVGIWLEITTLLIPKLNDSDEELKKIAQFIFDLGSDTPWHVSRFYPQYKMGTLLPTAAEDIHRAVEVGKACGLKYIYSGNIPGDRGENTFCFHCGELLIGRYGFHVNKMSLDRSSCPRCGTLLEGIF